MIDMARVTTMNYLKKELYELLREDPMVFDFLQKGSLDGIWYWDLENPEQEWMSPEFWTTLGYDPKNKQHLASEWQDLIHPEDLKVAFENFRKHCADPNHPYDQIVRYRHANGSTVWVRCRGVAIRDDSGKPVRMLGAHNEITVQKEAEISLQLTADTLKQAQQVAQIGSWWYDPETRLAFWSEEMFQLFGLEPGHDAVPYEDFKKRIHPRDRDRFDIAFNNAVARGVDCDLELRIVQPIGDIRYVHSKCTAIKDNEGDVTRLIGITKDITERRASEQLLIRTKDRLESLWNIATIGESDIQTICDHVLAEVQKITQSNYAFYGFIDARQETLILHAWSPQAMADCSVADKPIHFPIARAGIWAEAVRKKQVIILNEFSIDAPGKMGLPDGHIHLDRLMVVPLVQNDQVKSIAAVANKQEPYSEEDERQVKAFLSNVQIIIDQKRTTEELKTSERKFAAVFRHAPLMMAISDLHSGTILEVNKALLKISGYTREELIGKTSREIHWIGKEDREMLVRQIKTDGYIHSREIIVYSKNGTPIPCIYNGVLLDIEGIPQVLSISQDISKLKKTERNLQRSREMLVMAQEIANIGSWTWDIKTNELYWSDQFYRILGFQPGEIDPSLELFRSVIPQNDAKKEGEASKEAHELPYGNFEIEHRITTKDGGQRIVQSKGEIVNRDPCGNPLLMVGTTQDITAFRRSQEKIYEMAEMLDEAPSSITIHDFEGNFLYANRMTCEIHGYTHEEFMNLNLRHVDVPESEKLIKQRIKEILDKGQASFEVAHFHKDGAIIPMEVFVKLVEWRGQRAMMSIASDISERRKAEQALRESEQKFRNFSEQSFVGFYIIQNGFFKYVNPKFADIFGYTVDECINGMHFLQLVHTEDLARVQEQVHKRVTGQIDTVQHTFRGVKKSGEIIHVSIYGSSLIFQGRPAAIGTMMDITNELEMEKRMIQSQRMEAIGSLAGGIAHDFNNILFPIIGLSEMLVDDLPPGSTEHENAAEIYRAGIRGSGLVKQILAFGRQSGQKKVPIHIQQILKEAAKLSRSTIPSVITITQDIQSDCSLVRADPTQIHQIVMNLITNAYHAAEPVNGKISVRLREVEINFGQLPECNLSPGRYALLSVSDSGVGIDPAIVHKIFEPYFTTKEQGKGTGLGLSVVYGIVKDHHGDIKVYSELGKGTTFNVYLPIIKKATETVSLEGSDALSTGHERILLVDDEVAIAKLEKQMLERLGYEVTMRVNSLEALEAFKAKSDAFDMVISDMTMPDMTGDQLSRELLAIRSDIPIIICTGFSEKLNPVQAEAIGVKGFLMKPIVKAEMAKIVRRILDEAKGSDNGTVCPKYDSGRR